MLFSDPGKETLYQLIVEYYGDPDLIKIRNDQEFSLYGIQMPCLLLNERRYLILLCPLDVVSLGKKIRMSDLRWVSLQSRSLTDEKLRTLPVLENFVIKRDPKFEVPLRVKTRSHRVTSYTAVAYPIEVSLLHQRNMEFEYPDEGTLVGALETYQTILQWVPA